MLRRSWCRLFEEVSSSRAPGAGRKHGFVSKYFADRGFGFISPAEGGLDIFVQYSQIKGRRKKLFEGEPVSYEEAEDPGRRRPRAIHVQPEGAAQDLRYRDMDRKEGKMKSEKALRKWNVDASKFPALEFIQNLELEAEAAQTQEELAGGHRREEEALSGSAHTPSLESTEEKDRKQIASDCSASEAKESNALGV